MKFNHVVCGGTFDHLHKGHIRLLNKCLLQGKKVTVGVTTRAAIRHKTYIHSLETYEKRVKNVVSFNSSLHIYKLTDLYGPTLTDSTIDAICVTKETLLGAHAINRKRLEIGMKPLFILLIPLEYDNSGVKISSNRIRQGLINRQGECYYNYLISKRIHNLPESLKGQLRKPLGRVISELELLSEVQIQKMRAAGRWKLHHTIITVGDVITYNFKQMCFYSTFSIIDKITRRRALNDEYITTILEKDRLEAPNVKGSIQDEAVKSIYKMLHTGHKEATKQLVIVGEEDLLTLVVVLLAPLGSHVWYGQQGMGAIDIHVTEKKKETVYNLVKQFSG